MVEPRSSRPVPPRGLTVDHGTDGIQLSGELDTASVTQLASALKAAAHADTVSLDLAALTFIDSSGLRLLIETHQRLEDDGRRLLLRRPSQSVLRLLEISGVDGYLNLEP